MGEMCGSTIMSLHKIEKQWVGSEQGRLLGGGAFREVCS